MAGQSVTTFSRESTSAVLEAACAHVGLDPHGAELLRLGENAIYRLRTLPVVVRIARSMEHYSDAAKEVAVSRWLAERDMPAARTWAVTQPVEVSGHPVTFWQYIDGRPGGSGDARELGELLRRFHSLEPPEEFELPRDDVLNRVESRIAQSKIPSADQDFLRGLLGELTSAISELSFPMAPSVRHGDAHVQNLMITSDAVELIDFERVCWGHPEWDLAVTATEYVTAQFWTTIQYSEFVSGYGCDVMEWGGFPTLRRAQEFTMTTWLMQNIDESREIRGEYENRMETIRRGTPGRAWRAF
ncbi:phosphotransferase enzyme family protein [Pseudonocardia sp. GCM10023141]|uniref:phosphotransferase enzyme family protein n=1 Tax=Pseudonocardia sp. GCM10023141 TaxID=3252653 RepID=UPI00360BAC14